LSGASLHTLSGRHGDTILNSADLSDADLSDANLSGALLWNAQLDGADLSGASGVSNEKLRREAKSLIGTTMPDGQMYEDWARNLPDTPERTILPDTPGPVQAEQTYVTDEFEPAFSFTVGEGWVLLAPEMADFLLMGRNDVGGGALAFTSPLQVFDPSHLSEPREVPAPDNADEWASWFQKHPNLETSNPVPVSLGGASGERIDVTAAPTLEQVPRGICPPELPCVPLYPTSSDPVFTSGQGRDRFVIVDVEGETVVIDVGVSPASKFDGFLPYAQKVLDTVEWEGTQVPSSEDKGENSGPS
jgi:uncharacterized protein YjbI with pentapeptide repeats